MGLVPTPPTCEKPKLNWSLLRRYALIVPSIKAPLQFTSDNKTVEEEVELHCKLVQEPSIKEQILKKLEKPVLLSVPKLCNLSDSSGGSAKQKQLDNDEPLVPKIQESREFNERIPLLKCHEEQLIPKRTSNISLVRVPKAQCDLNISGPSDEIAKIFNTDRLLRIPATTFKKPYEFRLLSVEQVAPYLPASCAPASSLNQFSLKSRLSEALNSDPAIKLLDLRHHMTTKERDSPENRPVNEFNYSRIHEPPEKENQALIGSTKPRFTLLQLPRFKLEGKDRSPATPIGSVSNGKVNTNEDCGSGSECSKSQPDEISLYQESSARLDTGEPRTQSNQMQDKVVHTVSVQDFGMQFDSVPEEDTFIFGDYVIGRDGVRHIAEADRFQLPDPLANRDLLPATTDDEQASCVRIKDILTNKAEENQFLSICSIELSDWDAPQPVRPLMEVTEPGHLSRLVQEQSTKSGSKERGGVDLNASESLVQHASTDPFPAICIRSAVQKQSLNDNKHIDFASQNSVGFDRHIAEALNELDARLSAVDRVSARLQEEHQKNQELLERLIHLSPARRSPEIADTRSHSPSENELDANDSNAKHKSKGSTIRPSEKRTVSPRGASKPRVSTLPKTVTQPTVKSPVNTRKHISTAVSHPTVRTVEPYSIGSVGLTHPITIVGHSSGVSISGTGGRSQVISRKTSFIGSTGSLARKRERARIERRTLLRAKRCEDAVKLVNEVMAHTEPPPGISGHVLFIDGPRLKN